ncbi:MAG: type II toxin-antitoxin system PemK/MazF family toxin [Candidatus Diapherotrites archaeon]|nr:type II toxin-antitoxin system PemK/MazF family toxin [Candidatus Diapherotrites archaeon]
MQKNSSSFEQGNIVVADILYSQQVGCKRRPVLIISNSDFNRQSADIIVLSISSTPARAKYDVELENKDLEKGELRTESKILADFPTTIEKAVVSQEIGKISKQKLNEVKQKLKELYEL